MPVYFVNRTRATPLAARRLVATVERLLTAAGVGGASVSVTVVGDRAIRTLNRRHRGKDAATDVLSFPLYPPDAFRGRSRRRAPDGPELLLGDVVISLDTARRQAADYGAPLGRELERLLIHGILHLLGHDHLEPGERRTMERAERRLARAIGMPWPYAARSSGA